MYRYEITAREGVVRLRFFFCPSIRRRKNWRKREVIACNRVRYDTRYSFPSQGVSLDAVLLTSLWCVFFIVHLIMGCYSKKDDYFLDGEKEDYLLTVRTTVDISWRYERNNIFLDGTKERTHFLTVRMKKDVSYHNFLTRGFLLLYRSFVLSLFRYLHPNRHPAHSPPCVRQRCSGHQCWFPFVEPPSPVFYISIWYIPGIWYAT